MKNVGTTDALVRIWVAVGICLLYLFNLFTGTTALVLLGIALVLVVTGLLRTCPLYALLRISTRHKQPAHEKN